MEENRVDTGIILILIYYSQELNCRPELELLLGQLDKVEVQDLRLGERVPLLLHQVEEEPFPVIRLLKTFGPLHQSLLSTSPIFPHSLSLIGRVTQLLNTFEDVIDTRFDIDRGVVLARGCSTRAVSQRQHECDTQVSSIQPTLQTSSRSIDGKVGCY